MSVLKSKPALRWLVPAAAAVVVIGGGAAAGTIVASAEPSLPERSAAQLLVDVQNAKVDGLSGTIVQTADLGLPSLGGITGGEAVSSLISGSNTAKVWYGGEDKVRLALITKLGETDVVRNGRDTWFWQSQSNEVTQFTSPAGSRPRALPSGGPTGLPTGVPGTPQEAADAALAAIDPTTSVSTTGAAKVAGRDAYELVLSPKDTASLIGQVRIAIDAETHIPLGVNVYAKGANNPAVRVEFQQITFGVPDAEQFVFNPPPGAKVTKKTVADVEKKADERGRALAEERLPADAVERPQVIGKGWTTVVTAKLPKTDTAKGEAGQTGAQIQGLIGSLPKVSGTWGSGHLLAGTLFSALVTDDGRVLAGAVAPEKLYEAAAK